MYCGGDVEYIGERCGLWGRKVAFYNAASSEVFGDINGAAADESTPFSLAKSICGSEGDGCLGGGELSGG